jgi:predicted transcriptional regulator
MTKLSRNLTRIIKEDLPLIEDELNRIVPQMEELQKQKDGLMDTIKQQQVPRLNIEELQTLRNTHQKVNNQLGEIQRQVVGYVLYHL